MTLAHVQTLLLPKNEKIQDDVATPQFQISSCKLVSCLAARELQESNKSDHYM